MLRQVYAFFYFMGKKKRKEIEYAGWSHSRGHSIVCLPYGIDNWVYEDTHQPCDHSRACIRCKKYAEWNNPDPCLGWLPNVKYACCGHGVDADDYVLMDDGQRMSLSEYCNHTGFKKPKELE